MPLRNKEERADYQREYMRERRWRLKGLTSNANSITNGLVRPNISPERVLNLPVRPNIPTCFDRQIDLSRNKHISGHLEHVTGGNVSPSKHCRGGNCANVRPVIPDDELASLSKISYQELASLAKWPHGHV
jgi:hypothetical protein